MANQLIAYPNLAGDIAKLGQEEGWSSRDVGTGLRNQAFEQLGLRPLEQVTYGIL